MPRPPVKRQRRNNQRSPSNSRRVPSNTGLNTSPRVKLQQQLANKPIGQRPQDSDDSDRLVTRTRHGRNRRSVEPIFASGGVAKGDTPGVFPTKQERRERLRSETNEIVRRSRSKSADKPRGGSSPSQSISASVNKSNVPSSSVARIQASTTSSPQNALLKSHPTLTGERSVLGTLKPRRRQASILHMVDNNDSSIINPEDEEQFLPDDESTPLNVRKGNERPGVVESTTGATGSVSRKRKFGSDEPTNTADRMSTPLSSASRSETPATRQASFPLNSVEPQSASLDDDDIMALPQSSSAEPSPQKPKSPGPTKAKKTMSVPTTEQLQSLMPSKRRKGTRERKALTEFDIPDDSEPNEADQIEDESVFMPLKRGSRKDTSIRSQAKSASKGKKASVGTPAGKPKQTSKSTSTPLKPVTPRTPLPLTRNTNQENKTMSLAQSRTQNRDRNPNQNFKLNGSAKNSDSNSLKQTPNTNIAKQSGGSHLRRSTRGAVTTGAGSDKENSTSHPKSNQRQTRSSRKRPSNPDPEPEPAQPTIEVQASMDVDGIQPSIEAGAENIDIDVDADMVEAEPAEPSVINESVDRVSDSVTSDTVGDGDRGRGTGTDAKAWKRKWGDIDDWEMEFEEVDISTGASSPLRVSVV